jgi:hypothetical protein
MRGSSPQVTDENYAKNIAFSNVVHINTQAQSQNYYKQAGADTFLMEKCDTVNITNVIAIYPVERTAYFSCSRNVVCSVWNLKNALGVKFVGGSNTAIPVETIAKNCKVSDVHIIVDDATMTQQVYVAEFYWAEDLDVRGCTLNGNGYASVLVSTRHYVKDLTIDNCYGEVLKRGLFEYEYVGNIDNPDPTPDILAGNYTAGVENVVINNNVIKNSHTIEYYAIKLSDSAPPTTGSYRYKNITITNNRIDNINENYGIATANISCKGIIDINNVDGLRLEENRINGYYKADANGNPYALPFQVGSNSKNISIKHKETIRNQDFKYNFGTLYVSSDSEITISTISRIFSYQDTAIVTVKHDQTDASKTVNLTSSFRIRGTINIADSNDFALPIIGSGNASYPLPALFGKVDIIADTGDFGSYIIAKTGTVTIKADSSTLFVASTTDGKFAFFKDASLPRYMMRYKVTSGSLVSFIVNYTISV